MCFSVFGVESRKGDEEADEAEEGEGGIGEVVRVRGYDESDEEGDGEGEGDVVGGRRKRN